MSDDWVAEHAEAAELLGQVVDVGHPTAEADLGDAVAQHVNQRSAGASERLDDLYKKLVRDGSVTPTRLQMTEFKNSGTSNVLVVMVDFNALADIYGAAHAFDHLRSLKELFP